MPLAVNYLCDVFFLMIRRPPRSTLDRSSAASDVYKRQDTARPADHNHANRPEARKSLPGVQPNGGERPLTPVSYTHLRAHETVLDLVCRLLLEKQKKKKYTKPNNTTIIIINTHISQTTHIHT